MVAGHVSLIACPVRALRYQDAAHLAEAVRGGNSTNLVIIDLARTPEASTAALAKLIVLRRSLRRSGGDLRLLHLHGRARRTYNVHRLGNILPCQQGQCAPDRHVRI